MTRGGDKTFSSPPNALLDRGVDMHPIGYESLMSFSVLIVMTTTLSSLLMEYDFSLTFLTLPFPLSLHLPIVAFGICRLIPFQQLLRYSHKNLAIVSLHFQIGNIAKDFLLLYLRLFFSPNQVSHVFLAATS